MFSTSTILKTIGGAAIGAAGLLFVPQLGLYLIASRAAKAGTEGVADECNTPPKPRENKQGNNRCQLVRPKSAMIGVEEDEKESNQIGTG